MERTECSETSAYKIHTPGNYPEENIQHTEHGESLKSRNYLAPLKSLLRDGFGKKGCVGGICKAICQCSAEQLKQITKTCGNSYSVGLEEKLARAEYVAGDPTS